MVCRVGGIVPEDTGHPTHRSPALLVSAHPLPEP